MGRCLDEYIESTKTEVREEIAVNLMLLTEWADDVIEKMTGVPSERIEELRKGVGLIGKDILKLYFNFLKECATFDIACVIRKLKEGEAIEKIVDDGYKMELVNQVEQEIYLAYWRERT